MKRKAEEKSFTSNKESKNEDTQVGKYETRHPIILKIIECARNQDREELQNVPKRWIINRVDYKTGLSAIGILASNEEIKAMKFLEPYGIEKNLIVYGFAMGGHSEHTKEWLNQGASKDQAVIGAARGGYKNLVEWLISQGASKDQAVIGAARGGYKDLVKWLISQGASKDQAVIGAVKGEHKELVKWLISQGASKNQVVEEAAYSGQKELVQWLVSQGASEDLAVEVTATVGHKDLVEWLISQGASKDQAIIGAAKGGHKDLVKWLIIEGANKDQAMYGAAYGGHKELMEWLVSQGASKDWAVGEAAYNGDIYLVEWLINQGASKYWAIRDAAQGGHKDLVEWLISQGASIADALYGAIVGQQYRLATGLINNHQMLPPEINTATSTRLRSCFNIRYNAYSFIFGIADYNLQTEYTKFIANIIGMDNIKFSRNLGAMEATINQQKLSIQDAYVYYVEDKYIRSGISTPLGDYVASFYDSYTSDKLMVMGETKEIIIPNEILNKIAYFYIEHPKLKHNDTPTAQIYPSFSERVVDRVVNLWVNRINEIRLKGERISSDSVGM
ncbi:ankyrin repeat domain-containing protein [Holosporaceae bacterium 'Namur']|nr:ankyrin repeat domain-containing protein [Holosporaceae bacterium 'Namur']